jgi:Asp-tRNA(Asn)/Glu-tRNA(Gln) amidotransferase A subunit family amidase
LPSTQSFIQARDAFADGQDSPRALLERCLERIAARDNEVKAFVHLNAEGARAAADAATKRYRARQPLSLIDGLPIAIKDVLETADMPTGFGSPIYEGWRGGRDSPCALALRQAGAVLVGKVVTTEFAATETGPTRNPHDLKRTPGGSSSGSAAAVADGMVPVAIGTQVIGSVLRPASFCGIVGFKPTLGALNRYGMSDIYSQNCLGTLSRNLDDAWAVCHEIASRVGGDPGFIPFQGGAKPAPAERPNCIAVLETGGWPKADEESRRAFQASVERLAAAGVKLIDRRSSKRVERLEQTIADAREISRLICAYEAQWPFGELDHRKLPGLSKAMQDRVADGRKISSDEYIVLLGKREEMRAALQALVGEVDGFVTLSSPGPAPIGLQSSGDAVFNVPFTALGVPVLSLPLLKSGGLPLGFQLAGFPNRERALSAIAAFVLKTTGGA